jgi:hypothetical protein
MVVPDVSAVGVVIISMVEDILALSSVLLRYSEAGCVLCSALLSSRGASSGSQKLSRENAEWGGARSEAWSLVGACAIGVLGPAFISEASRGREGAFIEGLPVLRCACFAARFL